MKEFVIVAPHYTPHSMGVATLHKMCHTINKMGGKASMIFMETISVVSCQNEGWTNADWNTPVVKEEDLERVRQEAYVVYPEVVTGNPLGAVNVVRYMGNKEGFCNGGRLMEACENDFFITHSKSIKADADYVLFNAMINPVFFTEMPLPPMQRSMDATYIGKGSLYGDVRVQPHTVLIMRNWPINQEQLAIFLRNTRYVYTWDSWSATNVDAVLCGAVPYYLRYEPWTEAEIDGGELGVMPRVDATRKFNLERFNDERNDMIKKIRGLMASWDQRVADMMQAVAKHFC